MTSPTAKIKPEAPSQLSRVVDPLPASIHSLIHSAARQLNPPATKLENTSPTSTSVFYLASITHISCNSIPERSRIASTTNIIKTLQKYRRQSFQYHQVWWLPKCLQKCLRKFTPLPARRQSDQKVNKQLSFPSPTLPAQADPVPSSRNPQKPLPPLPSPTSPRHHRTPTDLPSPPHTTHPSRQRAL